MLNDSARYVFRLNLMAVRQSRGITYLISKLLKISNFSLFSTDDFFINYQLIICKIKQCSVDFQHF